MMVLDFYASKIKYVWIPGAFTFLFDHIASNFFEVDYFLVSFFFVVVCSFFKELGISYIIVVLGVNLLCCFDSEIIKGESSSFEGLIGTGS
jgi:hypothetical protein